MYDLTCPSCNSPSQYDFRDHLLMCPFCSSTFHLDLDSGQKELFGDHFIVANAVSPQQVKDQLIEWFQRLNHRSGSAEKEYFVTDISGLSVPFWIVSLEAHTSWKGLVKRQYRPRLDQAPGSDYLVEKGQFRRSYRWAVSARSNICESWGMTRLHEPNEDVDVSWDGFPLDSTFSRGQIGEPTSGSTSPYDAREFFEFKFANGLPILGIQVDDDEALRRASRHVDQYHLALSRLNVDYLLDYRTETEVAGVQLLHLPFWHARYIYKPTGPLKHFYRPKEKNVMVEGYNNGILRGELAMHYQDKVIVNAAVCAIATVILLILGWAWHPAFLLVAAFAAAVTVASGLIASKRQREISMETTYVKASEQTADAGSAA